MAADETPDDYYERLGVPDTASTDEIKAAFRHRARGAHSDTEGTDDRMRALLEAYEELRDADRRAAYDRAREQTRGDDPPLDTDAPRPYLTPDRIEWTDEDGRIPGPVTVRFSNGGGPATLVGPERWSGGFWIIDEWTVVMSGDDLVDYIVRPVIGEPDKDRLDDRLLFLADDEAAALSLTFVAKHRRPPRAPDWTDRADPLDPGAMRPTSYSHPTTSVAAALSRRRGLAALVLILICGFAAVLVLRDAGAKTPRSSATDQPTAPPASSDSSATAATPPSASTVAPSTVTVAVLNATSVSGLASKIQSHLASDGYVKGYVGDGVDHSTVTTIEYAAGEETAAQQVATALDLSSNAVAPLDPVTAAGDPIVAKAQVVVLVGTDLACSTESTCGTPTSDTTAPTGNSSSPGTSATSNEHANSTSDASGTAADSGGGLSGSSDNSGGDVSGAGGQSNGGLSGSSDNSSGGLSGSSSP